MSDHEGFEMLDETFGVQSESESSLPNSPQPKPPSPTLQLQQGAGSPSHHDVLHFGRVEMETGDETAQKSVGHAPSGNMMAISPQQTEKGCSDGAGTVPENDAVLKSAIDAGSSAPKDPPSRSSSKTKRDDDGENESSTTHSTNNEGHVGASPSPIEPSSTTPGACLSIPADKNKAVGQNDFPFASTTAMEEGTRTPGGAPVGSGVTPHPPLPAGRGGGHERTNADSPLPPAPPTAPAAPALFGTCPTASTASRTSPSCHFPSVPPAALETPFAAPLPLSAGKQQQQRPSPFGDPFPTTSRQSPSSAASESAEDEAALVELVGMGFDREHVVRALKECGRGESWKEAAISLLLEPQTSMTSGLSGGGRHGPAWQG